MTGTLSRLTPGTSVRGILPDALVTVVGVQWFGSEALELTWGEPAGKVSNQPFCQIAASRLEFLEADRHCNPDSGETSLWRRAADWLGPAALLQESPTRLGRPRVIHA